MAASGRDKNGKPRRWQSGCRWWRRRGSPEKLRGAAAAARPRRGGGSGDGLSWGRRAWDGAQRGEAIGPRRGTGEGRWTAAGAREGGGRRRERRRNAAAGVDNHRRDFGGKLPGGRKLTVTRSAAPKSRRSGLSTVEAASAKTRKGAFSGGAYRNFKERRGELKGAQGRLNRPWRRLGGQRVGEESHWRSWWSRAVPMQRHGELCARRGQGTRVGERGRGSGDLGGC